MKAPSVKTVRCAIYTRVSTEHRLDQEFNSLDAQYDAASAYIKDVRPEQFERRARLVSAIARGRRWLDDVVSGRVTTVAQLCTREKCSIRHVNMTISLAFLAPNLIKAAVEGRLPRGIGIERLRDPPTEWSRQFEALGLNPE